MEGKKKCLLHLCCAPDGTVPWEVLSREYDVTGYFYGGSIHPEEEFQRRKEAVEVLAAHRPGKILFSKWEPKEWFEFTRRYAEEPEKGKRCALCFFLQFSHAARQAVLQGCSILATTLTISPHKKPERILAIGNYVASQYGLEWLPKVWRKGGGFQLSLVASRELGLYRQNYCGCIYSKRTSL